MHTRKGKKHRHATTFNLSASSAHSFLASQEIAASVDGRKNALNLTANRNRVVAQVSRTSKVKFVIVMGRSLEGYKMLDL